MWALGVCLYLWVFGELPFKGSAPFVVYENIRNAPLVIPTHTHTRISPQLHDMISRWVASSSGVPTWPTPGPWG